MAFVLFWTIGVPAFAETLDDLLEKLEQSGEDASRLNLLFQINDELNKTNPEQGLKYAFQAVNLANAIRTEKYIPVAHYHIGKSYMALEQYPRAKQTLEKAVRGFRSQGNNEGLAKSLVELGRTELKRGQYQNALQNYFEALSIQETIDNQAGIGECWNLIGATYIKMGENQDALSYFKKSLDLKSVLGDAKGMASVYDNMGMARLRMGEGNLAISDFRKAVKINEELEDKLALSQNLLNIGIIYHSLEVYIKALDYYKQALDIQEKLGNKGFIASTVVQIGNSELILENVKEAEKQFTRGLELGLEVGSLEVMREAYGGLAEIMDRKGNHEKAYEYLKKYDTVNDSLVELTTTEEVADLRMAYEVEKREKEIEILRRDSRINELELESSLERQTQIIWVTLGGTVLFIIILLLVLNQNRLRRKANTLLLKEVEERKKTEEELKETNEELNTLMYRSSHDLKSPLASVIGLTNVAEMEIKDDTALKYMDMIRDQVTYLSTLLTNLITTGKIRSGAIQAVEINFDELLHRILMSINQMPDFEQVELTIENKCKHPFFGDINILTAIFQNILTNCIKYQDRKKQSRFCKVNLSDERNGVEIVIVDNGIGFSSEAREQAFRMFYRGSNQSEGSGLGLFIVMSSIRKALGTIDLQSKPNEGSTFTIYLPSQMEHKEPGKA